jgi:molybdate transport system ATP-binding protein
MLELQDVRRALPAFEVAATFDVAEETLALVGPSGAGKSSLLRLIAGLLDPDSGRIRVGGRTVFEGAAPGARSAGRGRPPVRLPPEARRVGLVFQDYALFPNLSVRANVAYGPRSRGLRRAAANALASAWLERLGIVKLADQRPSALSGGERQRVALARALASEPDALLLDEPLSALDAVTKAVVSAELAAELGGAGLPTVLVSHDFADVVGLADRIAVMELGRIVQVGTAAELLEAPASAFVAGFTGVNYFAGNASRRGELTEVLALDGRAAFVSTDAAQGPVGVVVLPWDVSVSAAAPEGSALNALAGPVRRVAVVGNRARVTVDSLPPVVAEITEGSARRLGLAPGVPVVATWKATGTRLVPRVEPGVVHRAG